MLAEVTLRPEDLVAPLFVREGENVRQPIDSMRGHFQLSVDEALDTVHRWADDGIRAVLLFGVPDDKDAQGSEAWSDQAAVQRLCRLLRDDLPELLVITDVCLCEYTDHGHCGPLGPAPFGEGVDVDNDAALELLARVAVSHARSGAHLVAPSAMMDGQVAAIREALDEHGLIHTGILSYAAKFASSLYGPFRDAAGSAPQMGDRRGYQMDPLSPRQAMLEVQADVDEGADMLMVKPAGAYLDIISAVRRNFDLPLVAYHVSGEYAMLKAAAANGWLDERAAALEVTASIKRAGADLIITYFAPQMVNWLKG
jgi:porphobilinogen synthase